MSIDRKKIVEPDDTNRDVGLIYLDDTLATSPATHVLIIGVGAFQSPELEKRPLTTTTFSARAIADWFLKPGQFINDSRPLGSLAMLLSEPKGPDGTDLSVYENGIVPRADFKSAQDCVKAWVRRVNKNKDNLVFLYVASHGESFLGRTAFLLEDYGLDDLDATSGMSSVEQFMSALGNALPTSQLLLFDCCRTPTRLKLPPGEEFGSKLISLTADNVSGEPPQQWVVSATSLGEIAIGRKNNTTLFADALLTCLQGVAADPSQPGWPVRPGSLVDKIDRLMALHRMPDERTQVPGGRLAGSFDINYPKIPEEVPVYISLDDPAAWPDAVIEVAMTPGSPVTIQGEDGQAPFSVLCVKPITTLSLRARCEDAPFGSLEAKAYGPVSFMQVKRTPGPVAEVVGHLSPDANRGFGDAAKIIINLQVVGGSGKPVTIEAGAIAEIVRRDEPARNRKEIAVAIGKETEIEVSPGALMITLRTPDGRVMSQDCTIQKNEKLRVSFTLAGAPHDWLVSAMLTGLIREAPALVQEVLVDVTDKSTISNIQDRAVVFAEKAADLAGDIVGRFGSLLKGVINEADKIAGNGDENMVGDAQEDIYSEAVYNLGIATTLELVRPDQAELEIVLNHDDGRFLRFDIVDNAQERYKPEPDHLGRPVFTVIGGAGRRELVAVPSLGHLHTSTQGGWTPYIVADRLAPLQQARCSVVVRDLVWGGMFGFLADRDMEATGKLLESSLREAATEAILRKRENPLASIAGGLVAIGSSQSDIDQRWLPWLHNLSNWYPSIPDGPIIIGWHLLNRAKTAEQLIEARGWFLKGYERGVPIYSLCLDWLARGLESFPAGDDSQMLARQKAARRLASLTDPKQVFTVIRLDD